MCQILTIEYPERALAFKSVAYGDGLPASAKWIREGILARIAVSSGADGMHGKAAARADLTPLSN
jgi:hypothetical protein